MSQVGLKSHRDNKPQSVGPRLMLTIHEPQGGCQAGRDSGLVSEVELL